MGISSSNEEFFKEAGQVVDVRFGMSNDGDGRFLCFGMVEFATPREAQKNFTVDLCSVVKCVLRFLNRGDKDTLTLHKAAVTWSMEYRFDIVVEGLVSLPQIL
ncbi:uncharacterized protein LOC106412445 [Brassica napus]|uniref:uncharacterized protein LOC106412445 n=1 Tax=Brassica napus TaxID=3708 RepID=UPI0006AAD910|nr:uncharacterized protein LOC106412445 [Brassica napus]